MVWLLWAKPGHLLHGEVRILIFDDPADLEESQRPPREGKLPNPRDAGRGCCMHGENLRNFARDRRAGAMRQLLSGQLDNTRTKYSTLYTVQK
jgi:hypothetical protein